MSAQASSKLYLIIWGWLAGLMLLGVVLSEMNVLPLSTGAIMFIVLTLSLIKALLVALYYMHLKGDRRLLALVAAFPLVLVGLAVCLLFSSKLVRL